MALGDGARDRGALADEIPGDPDHAGIGFVIDTGSRLPVRFRAGWVTDADIDDLATRCAPRPDTDAARPAGTGMSCPSPAPPRHTRRHEQGGRVMNTDLEPAPRHHRRRRPRRPRRARRSSAPCSTRCSTPPATPCSSASALGPSPCWSGRRGGWPAGCGSAAKTPPTSSPGPPGGPQHMPHLAARRPSRRDAGGGGVMWAVTGWVIATWLRVTLVLTAAVAVSWLALGAHSGAFWLVCAAAVLAEGYLSRQLAARVGPRSPPRLLVVEPMTPAAPDHRPKAGCGDASNRCHQRRRGSGRRRDRRSTTSTWSPP